MNVLVLCLSHGHGGLELYVYREIRYLISQGIKCIPVVSAESMLANKLGDADIDFYIFRPFSKHLPFVSAYQLAQLIKQEQVDILHISWGKDLNLAAMARYFSDNNVRLVYSRHMEITRSKKDILHRWFYKKVDLFLVISKMVEENALAYLPLENNKIKLLYLGVAAPDNTNSDCTNFFTECGISKRAMNVALFGRVEEGKAQHIMLEALAKLVQQKYDVSLAIIGHTMDCKYLEKQKNFVMSSGLADYVAFTGVIPDAIDKMPCFDVVVLTTPKETFGLVLAEAMRAGVAVIGTNAGGVVDIIDDSVNGLLFEPNDSNSLLRALSKLYEQPDLRARYALAGKKKADTVFSDEYHFQQLVSLFRTMCHAKMKTASR